MDCCSYTICIQCQIKWIKQQQHTSNDSMAAFEAPEIPEESARDQKIDPYIILQCVSYERKLRIRFHSYVCENGKCYNNAYCNSYNCRFPKNIRQEGRFYEIPADDLSLSSSGTAPFYIVKKANIQILEAEEAFGFVEKELIYSAETCVICLDEKTEVVFMPCGHACCCKECFDILSIGNKLCPLCRKVISGSSGV